MSASPPQVTASIDAVDAAVSISLPEQGSAGFQVEGDWVGTIAFEASIGGAWVPLTVSTPDGTSKVTSTTSNGLWVASTAGLRAVRARLSTYTSGSVNVSLQGTPSAIAVAGGGGGGGGGTVDQGASGVSPWLVSQVNAALAASSPSTGSVGITSAQLVAANATRTGLVLINLSGNTVSFGIGTAAVLYSGISLTPNGVWEMDNNTFTKAAIYAIASGAASTVAVQEFV